MQLFVSVCELTEVSQAGEGGGLQPAVVGEGVAGSDQNPLNAVQHQDVVVTLCRAPHQTKQRPQSAASYVGKLNVRQGGKMHRSGVD